MDSKSIHTQSQWPASSRRHTDSVVHSVNKRRRTEESNERSSKRRKSTSDLSRGCSHLWRQPQLSCASILVDTKWKKSRDASRHSEERRRRTGTTPSPGEGPSDRPPTSSCRNQLGTTSLEDTSPPNSLAAFQARYEECEQLGEGSYGSVFGGYRREDRMPVAIKHVRQQKVYRTTKDKGSKPLEVSLLQRLQPIAGQTSAVVSLLDWYDLDDEVIIVLERPVPSDTLLQYVIDKGGTLSEQETKLIIRQLVDAFLDIQNKLVLHRDIKPDNILVETSSDTPRVRIIDFGVGTYDILRRYTDVTGHQDYMPPEIFTRGSYSSEPLTVWQIGVVMYELLHENVPFFTAKQTISRDPPIDDGFSDACARFLKKCLMKRMESRATLLHLRNDPWLK